MESHVFRKQAIEKIVYSVMEKRLSEQFAAIQNEYDANREIILKEFYGAVDQAFDKAFRQQRDGRKQAAAFLCFHVLWSSLMTGSHEVRLDVYSKDYYLDLQETEAYFKPDFLFRHYEEDMDYLIGEVSAGLSNLKGYEKTALRKRYAANYYHILKKFLSDLSETIFARESYQGMDKEKSFRILFGEYYEKAALIAEWEAEAG